jgi:hypothetical protein
LVRSLSLSLRTLWWETVVCMQTSAVVCIHQRTLWGVPQVFEEPVVSSDGHTYERRAIERWLWSRTRSPMTNLPVRGGDDPAARIRHLKPNHQVKQMIAEWTERQNQQLAQPEIPFSELTLGLGVPRTSRAQTTSSPSTPLHFLACAPSVCVHNVAPPAPWLLGQSECGWALVRSSGSYKRVQKAEWRGKSVAVATVSE